MRNSIEMTVASAAAIAMLCLLPGCATMRSETVLPPVSESPSEKQIEGKIVWYELLTEDAKAAKRFYKGLLGWSFHDWPGAKGYQVIKHNGVPIAGMAQIEADEEPQESIWLVSISVADVDRAAQLTRERDGEVVEGPVEVAGRGRLAVLRDPGGAALIALHAAGGDPPDRARVVGGFRWADYVTTRENSQTDYYKALAGYEQRTMEVGEEHTYELLVRDGRARAGVVEIAWEGVEPNWLPYIGVADVDAAVAMTQKLGGKLLLQIEDIAILTDPTGGAFGVQLHRKGGK